MKKNMARLRKNSVFSALSGTIGKEIVFKQYADKVVVSKYPDMDKIKASERQKLQRNKMKEAQAHWLTVKRDPALREQYEKNLLPGESLHRKVIKAYMNASSTSSTGDNGSVV
jgi:hypothetical protein